MGSRFFKLKIVALEKATKDALTITLRPDAEAQSQFTYQPGQHLVFRFDLDEKEYRRSYSLHTCPEVDKDLAITVKRVKGGRISNWLFENLQLGDVMEALPPTGRFGLETAPKNYRTLFFFAAGSGITPIFSMIKAVLNREPLSNAVLFYGNRNRSSIIFRESLEKLEAGSNGRLSVVHTFSEPYSDWASLWHSAPRKGLIDTDAVEWFITTNPPKATETQYYVCGPGSMNPTVQAALMELGIEKERIHFEYFGVGGKASEPAFPAIELAQVKAHLNGRDHMLEVPAGKTILAALKEEGVHPPYSCESGTCGTCVAKVRKGKVGMRHCFALEEGDISKGLVLTCQALPQSEAVEISFGE